MTRRVSRRAYVGLGANLGDALATLRRAAEQVASWSDARNVQASSLYRSAPVDAGGPDYWNAVLAFDTDASPLVLLQRLQDIERQHGRERPFHHAPRTLDLDLLALGELTHADEQLLLPHPRLHQRAFVLLPLLELASGLALPGLGELECFVHSVADQRIERSPLQLFSSK